MEPYAPFRIHKTRVRKQTRYRKAERILRRNWKKKARHQTKTEIGKEII